LASSKAVSRNHGLVTLICADSLQEALHLTRISAFCSITPQFHHLDAMSDNEKASNRAMKDAENPAAESEARVVNMAVKSTDTEELDMGQVAKQLREIEEEPWQRLEWIDEDVRIARLLFILMH